MRDYIATYLKTCLICQQDKADHQKKVGLLEPLSIPTRPFKSVLMNYIIGLPKVEDFSTIIVMVNRLSKYATFIAAPKYITAEETAQLFFKHIQPLLPHIVDIERSTKSPQAKNFSQEWKRNIEIARSYLEKAQKRYKKAADLKRHFIEFNVGDLVLIKLPDRNVYKPTRGKDSKLSPKYIGPLPIVKRIGRVAYIVELPSWSEENTWEREKDIGAFKPLIETYHALMAPRTSPKQMVENVKDRNFT
ncbi:uncharacterized protein LOC111402967 [Olea europaea var. sylvestris]|uniref:uncharacterized protein LOC111402967 n=1 Tax=Olea europaea var. sylvestris TaxID=158386 RepID=UPI000C1D4E3A|nr:uncharacterized protein LOC111402967 [Olea europaea var. sylvestris]